jgi:hypothetical protein
MSGSLSSQVEASPRRKWLKAILFVLLAAAILLPIWIVHYPPILDFPNHLASSFVLAHLHDPNYEFGHEYSAHWGLKPYITTDFVMGRLGRIVPPLVAGKLVLSFGALGLPLAAWFFLRQANPGEDAIAFWFLLLAHNIFFRYGFVGFFWGISLMLLTLGLWLRWLKTPTASRWLLVCLALSATYFTHIMALVFTAFIMGIYSLTRPRVREWLYTAAFYVPAGLCYLLSSRVMEQQEDGASFRTVIEKIVTFRLALHGDSAWLDIASAAAVILLFYFGWRQNREFQWQWRWLVVAGMMFVAYFALPVGYGSGWDVDIRALPIFFIMIFATMRLGRRGWMFMPLALLVFSARTYSLTQHFRAMEPELVGLARSITLTPPNARVLPIVEGSDEDPMDQPYAHFWAYGTIERGWFAPYLFQIPGLLPLKIDMDSYTLDGFWELAYDEKLDYEWMRADYDYVWAYDVDQFDDGLRKIGDVIYTYGKFKLYRVHKQPILPAASPQRKGKPLSRHTPLNTHHAKPH